MSGTATPIEPGNAGIKGRFPKGCVVGIALVLVLVSGLTFTLFNTLTNLVPPPVLSKYRSLDSTRLSIRSRNPAPSAGARLSEADVRFYVGSLDSAGAGFALLRQTADTLLSRKRADGDERLNFFSVPELVKVYTFMPLESRRALVNYLNGAGRSWDEYVWAKERVIAASGITREEVQEKIRLEMQRYFEMDESDSADINSEMDEDGFARIEKIRAGIDSAEKAAVAPHRQTLLSKGLPSLMGIETTFNE